jgi:precorrin-3B synthase
MSSGSFTLDDGRGDVSGLGSDIGVHAVEADAFAVLLAGRDTGIRVSADDAVDVMLAAAHGFLDLSSGQWRLHEIEDGAERVADALGLTPGTDRLELGATHDIPIGWLTQDNGLVSLGAGVRLGSLPAKTAEFIAATERPVFLTPWRSLVIADLEEWPAEQVVRVLAPMGLIFDAESPWLLVSACAGQPGCAKSITDVRADVDAAVDSGRVRIPRQNTDAETIPGGNVTVDSGVETHEPAERALPHRVPVATTNSVVAADQVVVGGRQHWSGCDRRCGRPRGAVTDVVATPHGYRVG